jgi:hypothetical protein
MTNEEIAEKYGIEPIMKEMWVWDSFEQIALLRFVVLKKEKQIYLTIDSNGMYNHYYNASETNPNDKEPKVGDKGYFWDDEEVYLYATLINIEKSTPMYDTDGYGIFKHFSHEKQHWMK